MGDFFSLEGELGRGAQAGLENRWSHVGSGSNPSPSSMEAESFMGANLVASQCERTSFGDRDLRLPPQSHASRHARLSFLLSEPLASMHAAVGTARGAELPC